jgi:hypothetical protein
MQANPAPSWRQCCAGLTVFFAAAVALLQATEDIMLAIAAHKGLAAYALGASIVESGVSGTSAFQ